VAKIVKTEKIKPYEKMSQWSKQMKGRFAGYKTQRGGKERGAGSRILWGRSWLESLWVFRLFGLGTWVGVFEPQEGSPDQKDGAK